MAHFRKLRREDREEAIRQGIVRDVAGVTGFTPSTVSRTFADRFSKPNPRVVTALKKALTAMGLAESEAA